MDRVRKATTRHVQLSVCLDVLIHPPLTAQCSNAWNAKLVRDKDQCPRLYNAAEVIVHKHDSTRVVHVTLGTILQMSFVLTHSINGKGSFVLVPPPTPALCIQCVLGAGKRVQSRIGEGLPLFDVQQIRCDTSGMQGSLNGASQLVVADETHQRDR